MLKDFNNKKFRSIRVDDFTSYGDAAAALHPIVPGQEIG